MKLPLKFELSEPLHPSTVRRGNVFDATNKLLCFDIREEDANQLLAILDAATSLAVSSATMPKHRGNPVVLAVHANRLIEAVTTCIDLLPEKIYVIAGSRGQYERYRCCQPEDSPRSVPVMNARNLAGIPLTEKNLVLIGTWQQRSDAEQIRALLARHQLDIEVCTRELP